MARVLIGLSGGVDSTLTAHLLKKQGHEVIGVSMSIYNNDIPNLKPAINSCYGRGEKKEIKEIGCLAESMGIKEYYIIDASEKFKEIVLSNFISEYKNGRTPNPCILCNPLMKFGYMVDEVQKKTQFDFFATGHYARIEEKNGRFLLKKGRDEKKDQSYFLYRLTQKQLSQALFPLGNYTKEEVRQMAGELGLSVAHKKDSQDFYDGPYTDLLQFPPQKGDIILNGTVIGSHQGYWNYTIGQRKGLGVSYHEPLYVIRLDASDNHVILGCEKDLIKTECQISDCNWIMFDELRHEIKAKAKVRSTGQFLDATLFPDGRVVFDNPPNCLTAGQSIVFYNDDYIIGGGIIK